MNKYLQFAHWAILCVVIFSLIFPTTQASTGWQRTYQGGSMDILTPRSIVQTTDGGYAMAVFGYLRQESAEGLSSSYELQILKTDSNGAEQWKRSYPTVEDPNNLSPEINTYADQYIIVQTADQGYVVAGSGGQFWLFKVNSQGIVVWSRTYQFDDGSGNCYLYSMIQTNDGGFALAGSVYTHDGGSDFWIVKTDSLGSPQWNRTYNSGSYTDQIGETYPCSDEAHCVIQTSDGGYVLVGSNSLYRTSTSSIVYASWVVKTDAQGNQLWNRGYDLINDQGYRRFIVQTTDGGYGIVGTQNNDFCFFKITATGQLQWSNTYGEEQTDTPCGLVQLEDNGYAIAGTWTPINSTITRPTMGLIRTDSSGQVLWIKRFSAKEMVTVTAYSYDLANDVIRTSDGSYAIVGSTTFGSETHQDIFFVKTETLEQPPQSTSLPTPLASEGNPAYSPDQTSQPSSTPTQSTPTQNPSVSSTPNDDSSENIIQIDSLQGILNIGIIILVISFVVALVIIITKRRQTPKVPPPP